MNARHEFVLIALFAVFCSCNTQQKSEKESKGAVLPMEVIELAGPRPTINYLINGKPETSMIHSNAGMYIQLTPERAEELGVTDWGENGEYGITEPGKVGHRYKAVIKDIKMGNLSFSDVGVDIFSKPKGAEHIGMLGLPWITENRIVMDFGNNTVMIRPDKQQTDSVEKKLLGNGYIVLPMSKDDDHYIVEASINNEKANFTISTVSHLYVDSVFAVHSGVQFGSIGGMFGGPSGMTGNVYETATDFKLSIGDFEVFTDALIKDEYKYIGHKRPENETECIGGTLGAVFMMRNKAVIDFGDLKLYLKR